VYKRQGKFRAYYTKIDSGEAFEKYSRTGPYADIVVEADKGKFVFWRGSSYLPYWETQKGKTFVEEVIPRSGDGPRQRPDIVNTYSRIFLIESAPEKAVVWWRYLPEFGGKNPHTGVDATKFVDEYFTIAADGKVTRTIRQGTAKIDDWRDPANKTVQTFRLTGDGIMDKKTQRPSLSAKAKAVKGTPVKTRSVGSPAAWWKFDEAKGDVAVESVSGKRCTIEGHKSLWKKGVSGTSLQFDGYNSLIILPASKAPKVSSAITLEGWFAIGAYPWSWAPIVQQADDVAEELEDKTQAQKEWVEWNTTLKKEDDVGYFLGIDGYGHPGLKVKVGDRWEELVSDTVLERKRWYHIAGTYDKATGKMVIYINGKVSVEKEVAKGDIVQSGEDVRIGKGKPRRPIRPIWTSTYVDSYSFDGLIDEVKIYDTALSAAQIAQSYKNFKPAESLAEMDKRVLPAGKGTGEFGAYYTHLKFYETWDNLWRFSGHPDVVVEFDKQPGKFVFWRGVGYIPMLVNEKGHWYTNEFNETWSKSGGKGCQEPMSDKESYHNHAKIIENTPARAVIQWRFPLVDVLHVIANYNEDTGWGDWSDWYYYIYPDGAAVKTMHLWTNGERNHEWHETIVVMGPDFHPEEVLETEATLMLSDFDGKVDSYGWTDGPPEEVDYGDKKIHVVNFKASYDAFTIGDFQGGGQFADYGSDYSVFPTWNHWPVGQMPSDGRYAIYPDRTSHCATNRVYLRTYKEDFGDRPFEERLLMEGVSNKSAEELMPLAKSWLNPAAIKIKGGCKSASYDRGQRAYVMEGDGSKIEVVIKASKDSPIFNPTFVISKWDYKGTSLTINGEKVEDGKDLRVGHPKTVVDKDLVVWVRYESESDTEFVFEAKG